MVQLLPMPPYSIGSQIDTSEFSNALSGLDKTLKERRELDQNKQIGNRLATGDYSGGAAEAFRLGKLDTGLGIKKFATSEASAADKRQQELIARMAGLAQDALDEKDPARQADKFKKFMAVQGVTNALPEAYRADPRAALGYVVSSARGYQDPLDRRLKEAQIANLADPEGREARKLALQNQYAIELMKAKSQVEHDAIMTRAKALGLDMSGGGETPQQAPSAAPAQRAAGPVDPYTQLTQPAVSPQQEEAERKRRAAIEMVVGDQKQAGKILAKEDDPKEYQTKDALYAERMARSEITLRGITGPDAKKYNPGQLANKWWFDDSVFNGQNWRNYQAGAREWIAGMLRKDTGAAVTETEWGLYFPTYFPQPGDDMNVQKQKLDRRTQAARGLRASSGPAFNRMYPNFDAEMKQRLSDQDPARYGAGGAALPPGDYVFDPASGRVVPKTTGSR